MWEKDGTMPRKMVCKAGKQGFCAMYCQPSVGGSGMSYMDSVVAFEALGAASLQVSLLLANQNMVAHSIDRCV